jgi:hypothetical protein
MKIYADTIQSRLEDSTKRLHTLEKENQVLKRRGNELPDSRKSKREERDSLTKVRKSGSSLRVKEKSVDLKKSIAKNELAERVKKIKDDLCQTGIGTFRPSLTKLSKRF